MNKKDEVVAEEGYEDGYDRQRVAAVAPQKEGTQGHQRKLHEHKQQGTVMNQVAHHDIQFPCAKVLYPDQGEHPIKKV